MAIGGEGEEKIMKRGCSPPPIFIRGRSGGIRLPAEEICLESLEGSASIRVSVQTSESFGMTSMKMIPKIVSVVVNEDLNTSLSCMDMIRRRKKHFQNDWPLSSQTLRRYLAPGGRLDNQRFSRLPPVVLPETPTVRIGWGGN